MEFSKSEKKIIARIRKWVGRYNNRRYDFWLAYDDDNEAINWEGGFGLPTHLEFRNQYSLGADGKIVKNWS